jgi:hypothetical protein
MKIYLVVSIRPDGNKALVGHYPLRDDEGNGIRSEVYEYKEDAVEIRDHMETSFSHTGMQYKVMEVEV